jgi:single stranded DNA-binding protein
MPNERNNINKAIILGKVINYPTGQSFKDGSVVTYFQVETSESWTNKSGQQTVNTQIHNIVVIGRQAKIILKFLVPNSIVYLEGRLKKRKWYDQWNRENFILEIYTQIVQDLDYYLQPGDWNDLELYNSLQEANIKLPKPQNPQIDNDSIPF